MSPARPRERTAAGLWWSSLLSSASTWTMLVALFVYVLKRTDVSTLAVVELLGTLPALLAMPFAGVMADRFDPRRVAVASMLVQAVAVGGMLALLGSGPLWPVVVAYAVQGVANAAWPPSRQQWLYRRVDRDGWGRANAALGSVGGLTTIAGAGLGGVLSAWNPVGAMGVAAGLQALAVVPLLLVARGPLRAEEAHAPASPRGKLAEGIRAVRGLPLAASVVWVGIAWGCIGGAYSVLLAGRVVGDLHGGGAVIGGFYAVDGLAVIAGTLLVRWMAPNRQFGAYGTAYVVQGAAWAAVFLSPNLPLALAALAVMRLASGVIIALDTTILLATVPASLRGLVTSLHMTTYSAMARLSLALFGALLTVAHVWLLGVLSGAASALIGLIWRVGHKASTNVGDCQDRAGSLASDD